VVAEAVEGVDADAEVVGVGGVFFLRAGISWFGGK
jgi:hypothetical protein